MPRAPHYRHVWYVYFLELNNKDIYVGSTSDLRRRIASHAEGKVPSTRPHQPSQLRSYVAVETEAVARSLELYFKSGSGKAVALKRFFP
ncbi:GIY-YIG nuclease family protein [Roseiterribacter gracilis]|uniref:Excinuclease ABC subunit C n=1 Tax=Roseiterribacter gracilis TaxID=2812848 RepID=A0A8S8XF35_9PROT|nr:excinuclease ABC subunit C [Rhodospirillales bacterium TMPK1]